MTVMDYIHQFSFMTIDTQMFYKGRATCIVMGAITIYPIPVAPFAIVKEDEEHFQVQGILALIFFLAPFRRYQNKRKVHICQTNPGVAHKLIGCHGIVDIYTLYFLGEITQTNWFDVVHSSKVISRLLLFTEYLHGLVTQKCQKKSIESRNSTSQNGRLWSVSRCSCAAERILKALARNFAERVA